MKKMINLFFMFTVIFTIVTLFSSIWQLLNGQTSDTNAHILIRSVFTLVGVGFYGIFKNLNIKNSWVRLFIQYITSILFIFIVVWGIGFFGELSKAAYRDAFLNWSFIFLSVVIIQSFIKYLRHKRR